MIANKIGVMCIVVLLLMSVVSVSAIFSSGGTLVGGHTDDEVNCKTPDLTLETIDAALTCPQEDSVCRNEWTVTIGDVVYQEGDANSTPVEGAVLGISWSSGYHPPPYVDASTDQQGYYSFQIEEDPSDIEFQVQITHEEYNPKTTYFVGSDSGRIFLTADPLYFNIGPIVDRDGNPLQGYQVLVDDVGVEYSGADGLAEFYVISYHPEGEDFIVTLSKDDWVGRRVTVKPDEIIYVATFDVEVQGILGDPLQGVNVGVSQTELGIPGGWTAYMQSDSNGIATGFKTVLLTAQEQVTVSVTHRDYLSDLMTTSVDNIVVTMELRPIITVGPVVDMGGRPLDGLEVILKHFAFDELVGINNTGTEGIATFKADYRNVQGILFFAQIIHDDLDAPEEVYFYGADSGEVQLPVGLPSDIRHHQLNVSLTSGMAPLTVSITASAENFGTSSRSVNILIDDDVVGVVTLAPGESGNETLTHTFTEEGLYTVSFGPLTHDIVVIERPGADGLENYDLTVTPTFGVAPLTVTIEFGVENVGDVDAEDHIYVNGVAIRELLVPAGETVSEEFTYEFTDAGIYVIEWGPEEVLVMVTEEAPEIVDLSLNVDPTEGEDLTVTISVSARNIGAGFGRIPVIVDDTTVYTLLVPAGQSASHVFEYVFVESGTYLIEFGDLAETVVVHDPHGEPEFIPHNLELTVTPTEGKAHLKVTITISADNMGDANGTLDLLVGGSLVYPLDIPAKDSAQHTLIYTFETPGIYEVSFGNIHMDKHTYVEVYEPEFVPGNLELDVTPMDGYAPLEVTITISADNMGGAEDGIELMVNNSTIYNLNIPAYGSAEHNQTYTFETPGTYEVVFGELRINVTVEDGTGDGTTSGLGMPMWVIPLVAIAAIVLALVLIMKKKGGANTLTLDDEEPLEEGFGEVQEQEIPLEEP